MLIIPLRMQEALRTRPFVSLILGLTLLYQSLAPTFFPQLVIVQSELLAVEGQDHGEFAASLFLSMLRGATPISGFFLTVFWLVIGRGLEHHIGSLRVILIYLGGCGLLYFAGYFGIVRWEPHLWLGLGGNLACMAASYYHAYAEDVTFFYLILTPFHISAGFSTTAALFLTGLVNMVLAIGQLPAYERHETIPEGLVSAPFFTVILPLVLLPLWVAAGALHEEKVKNRGM